MNCYLIGTSKIAVDYFNVLKAIGINTKVIGRGIEKANSFFEATQVYPVTGGVSDFLSKNGTDTGYDHAIVAVGVESLFEVAKELIERGIHNLLIEKPGALSIKELKELQVLSEKTNSRIRIGYNRRFYSSTLKAREIIDKDGGVMSFSFDFTELGDKIKTAPKNPLVKKNWFYCNSTHVVDMAFYLCGEPLELHSIVAGDRSWHPYGTIYAGMGKNKNNAIFTYRANWDAPGRWGIELETKHYKLIFKPLEKILIQRLGSFEIEEVELDDEMDKKYKPGLYYQVDEFFNENHQMGHLKTIEEQIQGFDVYNRILGL